jgi:hypothetical protein
MQQLIEIQTSVMVGLQYRQRGKQGSSAAGNRGETPCMPVRANFG